MKDHNKALIAGILTLGTLFGAAAMTAHGARKAQAAEPQRINHEIVQREGIGVATWTNLYIYEDKKQNNTCYVVVGRNSSGSSATTAIDCVRNR